MVFFTDDSINLSNGSTKRLAQFSPTKNLDIARYLPLGDLAF